MSEVENKQPSFAHGLRTCDSGGGVEIGNTEGTRCGEEDSTECRARTACSCLGHGVTQQAI